MTDEQGLVCDLSREIDISHIKTVSLNPDPEIQDYQQVMALANDIALKTIGGYMLLSWYDRDRDFESPQHSSECHEDSAVPGYVDYGVNHGATLLVDFYSGRFVFFYMPVDF